MGSGTQHRYQCEEIKLLNILFPREAIEPITVALTVTIINIKPIYSNIRNKISDIVFSLFLFSLLNFAKLLSTFSVCFISIGV